MSIKRNYCYIKVTNDKYRLPIAVADSAGELARIVGATKKRFYLQYRTAPVLMKRLS